MSSDSRLGASLPLREGSRETNPLGFPLLPVFSPAVWVLTQRPTQIISPSRKNETQETIQSSFSELMGPGTLVDCTSQISSGNSSQIGRHDTRMTMRVNPIVGEKVAWGTSKRKESGLAGKCRGNEVFATG